MRRCAKCTKVLPETDFSYTGGLLRSYCKPCYRDGARAYDRKNRIMIKDKKPVTDFLLQSLLPHCPTKTFVKGLSAQSEVLGWIESYPQDNFSSYLKITLGGESAWVVYSELPYLASLLYKLGFRSFSIEQSVPESFPLKKFYERRLQYRPKNAEEIRSKYVAGMTDFGMLGSFFKINPDLLRFVSDLEGWPSIRAQYLAENKAKAQKLLADAPYGSLVKR